MKFFETSVIRFETHGNGQKSIFKIFWGKNHESNFKVSCRILRYLLRLAYAAPENCVKFHEISRNFIQNEISFFHKMKFHFAYLAEMQNFMKLYKMKFHNEIS